MSDLVFNINTGPLPWEQIEQFYKPLPELPPWSEEMVKYGRMVDPAKRSEKRAAVYADYERQLSEQSTKREEHRLEFVSKASLSPLTATILAIGFRNEVGPITMGDDDDEAAMLGTFWDLYRQRVDGKKGRLIGFNSAYFDLPFIVQRSWFHKIFVPESVIDKKRYWSPVFVDLMQIWGCGSHEFISLNNVCKFMGIVDKGDLDGSMFAGLWTGNEESHKKAVDFSNLEVEMTWQLGQRMGVIL